MQLATLVKSLLGVEHLVVEAMRFSPENPDDAAGGVRALIVRVRPMKRRRLRCPECLKGCPGYDRGDGLRRWRSLDLGTIPVYLEAEAPRVKCRTHGVRVAQVPWARPGAGFTTAFEDQTAWLVTRAPKTAVQELMRITWRSVSSIVTRVVADARKSIDRLEGLTQIGIDDKSYKKGHKYLMVVVDHATGRVVWAKEGRDQDTVRAFFAALGPERAAQLTHVSCDGAQWIHDVITEKAPQAMICMDAYHTVQWATEAVDEVRRRITRDAKANGQDVTAGATRWAVLKNPTNLTTGQRSTLAQIKRINAPLYRAYLIKEQLREAFRLKGAEGRKLLNGVISWAQRSRLPEMEKLARTLKTYRATINNTLDSAVSNGRVEAMNTHIQTLIKRAYGYTSAETLIAMIELTYGGLAPALPGR